MGGSVVVGSYPTLMMDGMERWKLYKRLVYFGNDKISPATRQKSGWHGAESNPLRLHN